MNSTSLEYSDAYKWDARIKTKGLLTELFSASQKFLIETLVEEIITVVNEK